MSIESTYTVKKSDALDMLRNKGVHVYDDDCNDRLADLLYENRESIFENYCVINDSDATDENKPFKYSW